LTSALGVTIHTIAARDTFFREETAMPSIDIDFEVYKALTVRRDTEDVTESDVIRKLLNMPPATPAPASGNGAAPGDWLTKGVRFPDGTDFRATYKGQTYTARVAGGALVLNGQTFASVSSAARAITGSNVDGWRFWQCRLPGKSAWVPVSTLRP
jgi:hypothetical protein